MIGSTGAVGLITFVVLFTALIASTPRRAAVPGES
jgi:hypothetical protein